VLRVDTVRRLVDEIASKAYLADGIEPTSSTILGPFWSPHAPFRNLGDSIIQDHDPAAKVVWMHGVVRDVATGEPIQNAVVDIWQASANGEYDLNDGKQSENNLRGKFRTNERGEYYFYCYHPTAYSIPTDGAGGELLKLLDRHAWRTAHIHAMVTAPNYRSVTTQLFPRSDRHIANDTVFAVKEDLIVDFTPSDDPKADLDLKYDFTLALLEEGTSQGWSHTVF
jgi:catechol 1,2-dioxygenase